jgi:DNA repair exonuclease SbcCD ATPase subunit
MIKFKSIRWKNFLSTGNAFTEVQFDRSPNTLIVGNNGAGKSTILDALTFALFGKPFRKISKGQLINSINGGGALVEAEFSIGRKEYLVRRGIKKNIFEIEVNGIPVDENANNRDQQEMLEKTILKLNYKSFTQVIILGSASFTPFMQLSASNRREVIENLLDIEIFSVMNSLLKSRAGKVKQDLIDCNYNLDLTREKLRLQTDYIETLETDKAEKVKQSNEEITASSSAIASHEAQVDVLHEEVRDLSDTITDKAKQDKLLRDLSEMRKKLNRTVTKHQEEISFYEENEHCPTCDQNIDEQFKVSKVSDFQERITNVESALPELKSKMKETEERLSIIADVQSKISTLNQDISVEQSSISGLQKYISKLQKELNTLLTEETKENDAGQIDKLRKNIQILSTAKEKLIDQQYVQNHAATLLKDTGIKTKIIRQYLPIINKLVNKYLSSMDFFVQFELDEAFNETIKSRHRDDFSYDSFSEGEKMRIDLALLFTWRSVAKMKNSVNTNLLILDEVFDSSLDGGGTEEFMKILDTLSNDTNVFVISHKGDQLFDKFHSVIQFEKVKNYSRIAK